MMKMKVARWDRWPLAHWCAAFFGVATSILILGAPHWMVNGFVRHTSLGNIAPLHPPLGAKRTAVLAVVIGLVLAGAIAAAGWLVERFRRPSPPVFARGSAYGAPQPDRSPAFEPMTAPLARQPIFAERELGAPLMSEAALEQGQRIGQINVETVEIPKLDWIVDNNGQGSHAAIMSDVPEPMPTHQSESASGPQPKESHPVLTEPEQPLPTSAHAGKAVTAEHDLHHLSIDEMIQRLETGLANRGQRPPEPPVPDAQNAPATLAATPALTLVSNELASPNPSDIAAEGGDDMLRQAMATLSRLATNAR